MKKVFIASIVSCFLIACSTPAKKEENTQWKKVEKKEYLVNPEDIVKPGEHLPEGDTYKPIKK